MKSKFQEYYYCAIPLVDYIFGDNPGYGREPLRIGAAGIVQLRCPSGQETAGNQLKWFCRKNTVAVKYNLYLIFLYILNYIISICVIMACYL